MKAEARYIIGGVTSPALSGKSICIDLQGIADRAQCQ